MFEAVSEAGTSPTQKAENERKRSQSIYASMLRVLSYVSQAGKAKLSLEVKRQESVSYCKSWEYMANPYHVIGSKCADVVESINHVTFLTNRFSRLISLPTSTIFVSGTSESVSYFLEFSCITAILGLVWFSFSV